MVDRGGRELPIHADVIGKEIPAALALASDTGAGVGTILGIAALAIPGVGPLVAAGAIASSAIPGAALTGAAGSSPAGCARRTRS